MIQESSKVAVLLLAAGASSRLGHPKQLIVKNGQTLLEKEALVALDSGAQPVVVVLGAYAAKIKPAIARLPLHILQNEAWESGMGSSIACGIQFLEKEFPEVEAVILMLCDQPFVQADTLIHLVQKWHETGKGIIASTYGDSFGPPALFGRHFFPKLLSLQGEKGAKAIMLAEQEALVLVPFPEGKVDLDTPEDCAKWLG